MAESFTIWPEVEQSRVGWHYLAVLAELYPGQMQKLVACGAAYGQAICEDVPPGVVGWRELPFYVAGPGEWKVFTPAVARYRDAEHAWAGSLGLLNPYGDVLDWVHEAVRIVLAVRLHHEPETDLIGLCRQLAADPHSWLGGKMLQVDRPDDPMPAPLNAAPQFESLEEFTERAKTYYQQQADWLHRQGHVRKKSFRRLRQGLYWVAWRIIDGLTWEAVAGRSGESVEQSTVRKSGVELVKLLGLYDGAS